MERIIPKQGRAGLWMAYDTITEGAYAKSIWFEDGYETYDECLNAIHDYLEFACTDDYSDKMRGI